MNSKRGFLFSLPAAFLSFVFFFPPGFDGNATVHAQSDGRNVFNRRNSDSESRPKVASEELKRSLNQAFGREFGEKSIGSQVYYLFFFLFMAVLVGGLLYYDVYFRQRRKASYDDPRLLFRELCDVHGLTKAERRFLRDMADELDLDDPLPLFIEPRHFRSAAKLDYFRPSQATLRYLSEKLFDFIPETVADEADAPTEATVAQTAIYLGGGLTMAKEAQRL